MPLRSCGKLLIVSVTILVHTIGLINSTVAPLVQLQWRAVFMLTTPYVTAQHLGRALAFKNICQMGLHM